MSRDTGDEKPIMKVTIASGKGGTGKTTVATNLAWLAARQGLRVVYADCDVEEPNGHLFLHCEISEARVVRQSIPEVDAEKCNLCGLCGGICQFSAIAPLGKKVLVFAELCHACGGCFLVCPSHAIHAKATDLGVVESGHSGTLEFVQGRLNVGALRSVRVIHEVKAALPAADLEIRDAPPGTSCLVVETIRGADFVVLVTEATPFGLHDLKLAVAMIHVLQIKCGVVVNRALPGRTEVRQFCQQARLPILAEIPDDMSIAQAYSEGKLVVEAPGYRRTFAKLLRQIAHAAAPEAQPNKIFAALDAMDGSPGQTTPPSPLPGNGDRPVCYLALRSKMNGTLHQGVKPGRTR
jgi:MinD superfamily P-loop ATPase